MRILMVAAENGVLPGGKVGGMADVVAQLPAALTALGPDMQVDVLIPSYGIYHQRQDAEWRGCVTARFGGSVQKLDLYRLHAVPGSAGQWVLDHPVFGDPPGRIYHHDSNAPFATDANLYALFSAGVAACLHAGSFWPGLDVLHLHDWHTAGVLLFMPPDKTLRTVFSIHNLALQGQRPLQGHPSSFKAWFDTMECPANAIDPRYPDCYNPMRLGITTSDRVHTVSPGYAREILKAGDGFGPGGEGLQADLQRATDEGRLHGILNGCDYPPDRPRRVSRSAVWDLIEATLAQWVSSRDALSAADYLAMQNLARVRKRKTRTLLLTSVGRLVPQKVDLFRQLTGAEGQTALDQLLEDIGHHAVLVVLGTGDADCEQFFIEHAARHRNLVYLRGYDDDVANALYDNGDLFLMPSSFEPCGISQMLAMRGEQPCVVHATGGLKDTVRDGLDGFVFEGADACGAARAFVERLTEAIELCLEQPDQWQLICRAAGARRFRWNQIAADYRSKLYRSD
jgi:starch synthase